MMIKKLFFWFVFFSTGMQAQIIDFPDANFKAKLLAKTDSNGSPLNIDTNNDGEIQISEAESISRLYIKSDSYSTNKITSLEGIAAFKNLEALDCSDNKLTALDLSALVKLSYLNCAENDLKSLNLQNFKKLTSLICYDYNGSIFLNSLNVEGCENLTQLICYTNGNTDWIPINLQGCTKLQTLHCSGNSIENSNIKYIPNIVNLNYTGNNSLNLTGFINLSSISYSGFCLDLNLENCINLSSISITGYNLSNLNIKGCSNLQNLSLESVSVPVLDLSKFKKLNSVFIQNTGLTSLAAEHLPELTSIFFRSNNKLSFLSLEGCGKLEKLELSSPDYNSTYSDLSTLNLRGCTSLNYLKCNNSKLTELDVSDLLNLTVLICSDNLLSVLDLKKLSKLQVLNCNNNQLTSLDLNNAIDLKYIDCSNNELTHFKVPENSSVVSLNINNNPISELDLPSVKIETLTANSTNINYINLNGVKGLTLENISSENFKLSTIDKNYYSGGGGIIITNNPNLKELNLSESALPLDVVENNPNLESINVKNGINDFYYSSSFVMPFSNNNNLKYICADDNELIDAKSILSYYGYNNINVNTYCSFTSGGSYNTITGTAKYDSTGNGCDTADNAFEYLKLKIDDGTDSGETFVQNNGKYEFNTQEGNFSVTAQAENPALFSISPFSFSTSFADSNNKTFTQDICVTANGTQNDAEVVIAPLTGARPGFDATYKLVWRNKGNTTLSGKVIMNFDSNKMTFKESSLPYSAISNGSIEFNYANLKPYANDGAEITFTINTPTNPTNPVNSGDILAFNAQITPSNSDLTPEDNTFGFNHTVVNSFDPNDIVCMEGEKIPTVAVGKYMHYVVNFENLGTAEAENIVVKMEIDPSEFDINTLQLQNASAAVTTKVTGNIVEFIFKKIKLKSGGHGNVLLKMKSITTLQDGDKVNNKANIYFDYNFPVETNDYVTTIQDLNSVLVAKINYTADDFTPGNYPVNFDASLSTGDIASYAWEFSGNPLTSSTTSATPVVTYSTQGNYTAKLTVYDADNNASTQTISFKIGDSVANLSTGKDSNGNSISIDSDDDDWKGYNINGVQITPKVRHTFIGWGSADIGNGNTSQWITLNTAEGYYNYKSSEFTIPENATDAKLNLRSLSFVRNWTYLVKINPDGSEDETEITKTQYLNDGFKGWLNSRSPKVEDYALSPGRYYIKVLVYSNNPSVRESLDVNALVTCSAGLIYKQKMAPATPTLGTDQVKVDQVKVYPIPTKGELNIVANETISNVEVYDAAGRIVHKQIFNTSSKNVKININSPRGIYYLKIKTSKELITQKIIKE